MNEPTTLHGVMRGHRDVLVAALQRAQKSLQRVVDCNDEELQALPRRVRRAARIARAGQKGAALMATTNIAGGWRESIAPQFQIDPADATVLTTMGQHGHEFAVTAPATGGKRRACGDYETRQAALRCAKRIEGARVFRFTRMGYRPVNPNPSNQE